MTIERKSHQQEINHQVKECGLLSDGKKVVRLSNNHPDVYGYFIMDPSSEIFKVDPERSIGQVNSILLNLSLPQVESLPELFIVINKPEKKKDKQKEEKSPPQVIDVSRASERRNLVLKPQNNTDYQNLDFSQAVRMEGNLYMVGEDSKLSIVDASSGEVYTSHHRRCSSFNLSAAELLVHIPQLETVENKKWRELYAKEIWRRMIEPSLPEGKKQTAYSIANVSRLESEIASSSLEEWVKSIAGRNPSSYWQDKFTEAASRINPEKFQSDYFPPHMRIESQEEKAIYAAANQIAVLQETMYKQIARKRKYPESGNISVHEQHITPDDISSVEQTITRDEIEEYLMSLKRTEENQKKDTQNQSAILNSENARGTSNPDARLLFDQYVEAPVTTALGPLIQKTNIRSTIGPFLVLPEYRTQYPAIFTQALENLYAEYNEAFRPLVKANREWNTDYQFCMTPDGMPINGWVQIDMVGLPDGFLKAAPNLSEKEVRESLRGRIFEIENSLAMYQLMERIFSYDGQDTLFKRQFRASLDGTIKKYGRPIALLAVTDQKYKAMRESEFGKMDGEPLTDGEVTELSGFDKFFGPKEFEKYLAENGGECNYLLYARTSDPVAKLKKPDTRVEIPLLENDDTRRIIKANAITFNVDSPAWEHGSLRRINDTKAYLQPMGMAYEIRSHEDLDSPDFKEYLLSQGIHLSQVASRDVRLRAKPMQGTYGCYGHASGTPRSGDFRQVVKKNLRERGVYVIQPEMPSPIIINETDGQSYTYIDRNFFSTDGQNYRFMGGFRSLMPVDSTEAKNGRNHGSSFTVWAEIS